MAKKAREGFCLLRQLCIYCGIRYPERSVIAMTLGELKQKDVINTQTGASLGRPMDIEFCAVDGRISALVVPGEFSFLHLIRGEKCGFVIPWENICKIGDDVILVDLCG